MPDPLIVKPRARGHRFSMAACSMLICSFHLAGAHEDAGPQSRWTDLGDGVLKDGRTGLQWTRQDNGSEIDWNRASHYCEDKRNGWRLPDISELLAIYEAGVSGTICGRALCHLSPRFDLSGEWFWSATPVGVDGSDGPELSWGVLMVNGARTPSVREAAYGARALCVRNAS